MHVLFVGCPVQVNATLPVTPATELNSSGYVALAPLESVAVVLPAEASEKSIPKPLSETVCVAGVALSISVNVPLNCPAAVGANATCSVQAAATASVAPQLFAAILKFEDTTVLVSVSTDPPLFVSVTACAADTSPFPVAANASDAGLNETPAPATPTPLIATVCNRTASVNVSVAVRVPGCVGTNATLSAHVACPASDVPHPFTTVKSPGLIEAFSSVSGTSPAFAIVTCCAALVVPTICCANVSDPGVSVSVAGASPTPVSVAVCVPATPPELSAIANVPVRVPLAVGVNVIETVHPVCDPSVAPHVFAEIAKSPVDTGVCSVAALPPVFEIVMFCAAVVWFTTVAANVNDTGVNTMFPAAVAVPLNATVACPPATFA